MSFPQSTSYVNTIPVQWSISPTNQVLSSIKITFTYCGGHFICSQFAPISYSFTLVSLAYTGSFTFSPYTLSLPSANLANCTGCSALPMYDGTYTARMFYTRTDGAVLSTITTATFSISTYTLPPVFIQPADNSLWSRFINMTYSLPNVPRLSGFPVQLTIIGSSGDITSVLSLASEQSVSFLLDTANIADNTTLVRNISATYLPALPDDKYTFNLSYFNSVGHPENFTAIYNLTIQTSTPAPVLLYPDPSGSLVTFTTPSPIRINFTWPVAVLASSLVLSIPALNVTYTDLPTTSAVVLSYAIPNIDTSIPDGNQTFLLSYQDSLGNPVNTTTFIANIQRHTLPATLLLPVDNSNHSSVDGNRTRPLFLDIAFTLGEAPLEGSVNITFFKHFPNVGIRVPIFSFNATTTDSSELTWNYSIQIYPELVLPANLTFLLGDIVTNGTFDVAVGYQDEYANDGVYSDYVQNVTLLGDEVRTVIVTRTLTVAETESSSSNPYVIGVPFAAWAIILFVLGASISFLVTYWALYPHRAESAGYKTVDIAKPSA